MITMEFGDTGTTDVPSSLQVAFRQPERFRMCKVQIDQALFWTFLSCAVFCPRACVDGATRKRWPKPGSGGMGSIPHIAHNR